MDTLIHADRIAINREYYAILETIFERWNFRTRVDILFVVDTEIATQPGVGFGVGSVIEHIRAASVGCMRFRVDIALRNGESPNVVASPGTYDPRYRGFRFDMQDSGTDVIDRYDQIWCFGFKPSNSGSPNDAEIDLPSSFPASNSELAKLSSWMDVRKGGLFGTGDHHFLGASMCRKIPRLGTMRRWTNADSVPPIGTPDRIDTLRPPSAAYEPGAPGGPLPMSNTPHQGDLKVQPIKWTTWQSSRWPLFYRRRPHPVLCHPTLGPIDVMPDHAHEGLCVPTAEIDLAATYDFDGSGPHDEYPPATGGGAKPEPGIIAYGSTLGHPPYNFSKGPQPARSSFPMIAVYDGHRAGVGRVATDSTWHHWMDINIDDIKAANNDDWNKISRYYVNLAVWLTPPGFIVPCLYLDTVLSHFRYPGFEEYQFERTVYELGRELRLHLHGVYGPCWVSKLIWDYVLEVRPKPWEIIQKLESPFTFGGIDADVIEDAVLGELVVQTSNIARRVKKAASYGKSDIRIRKANPDRAIRSAVESSFETMSNDLSNHYKGMMKVVRAMRA